MWGVSRGAGVWGGWGCSRQGAAGLVFANASIPGAQLVLGSQKGFGSSPTPRGCRDAAMGLGQPCSSPLLAQLGAGQIHYSTSSISVVQSDVCRALPASLTLAGSWGSLRALGDF